MVGSNRWCLFAALLLAVSCDDKGDDSTASESDADTDADADTDTDTDVDKEVCGDSELDPGEDCDDGAESASCDADCSAVECGDTTVNGTAGEDCDDGGESATCNGDCTVSSCGDGVMNATAGEDCDGAGESADCNADCSVAACGDGIINATAGEICEPTSADTWDRCASCNSYGAGLDGTWGKKWEILSPSAKSGQHVYAFQGFHFSGEGYLYDSYSSYRYEIATDSWSYMKGFNPVAYAVWRDGAVDGTTIWVPANGVMNKFDLASETWTSLKSTIPDSGYPALSAAVFDGEGYIWYHSSKGLVRYDPATDTASAEIVHDDFDVYETRMAYDPIGNRIAFGGYSSSALMIYDITKGTFTTSATNPGGSIHDNSCGDNSGGMYVGSSTDEEMVYRYDFATDTFTALPAMPAGHDNNSTCVVSQDGYLYEATAGEGKKESAGMFRLPLGTYAK
jgi:hypothetical protein